MKARGIGQRCLEGGIEIGRSLVERHITGRQDPAQHVRQLELLGQGLGQAVVGRAQAPALAGQRTFDAEQSFALAGIGAHLRHHGVCRAAATVGLTHAHIVLMTFRSGLAPAGQWRSPLDSPQRHRGTEISKKASGTASLASVIAKQVSWHLPR